MGLLSWLQSWRSSTPIENAENEANLQSEERKKEVNEPQLSQQEDAFQWGNNENVYAMVNYDGADGTPNDSSSKLTLSENKGPPIPEPKKEKKQKTITVEILYSGDSESSSDESMLPKVVVNLSKKSRSTETPILLSSSNVVPQIESNPRRSLPITKMDDEPSTVAIHGQSQGGQIASTASSREPVKLGSAEPTDCQSIPRPPESFINHCVPASDVPAKTIVPKPVYNILLLGETGAGKSTTINALANYLKLATFDKAKDSAEFVQLIPSKFTLPHPQTGLPFVIQSGAKDDNEQQQEEGSSNTQSPMGYTFTFKDRVIRIIDTPGMGDTRGQEFDRQNFDLILSYLNYHTEMHAICILIKSNETRRTASFRYCITELLANLHKSACQNIIFCFTFSRNSFYGPGEGFTLLKNYLKSELKEVNIEPSTKVNCFFIDNEAYRFLVAKKQGYPFPESQTNMFRESWDRSAKSTQTMIDHIVQLKPHNLIETTSLNHARKLMMELAEPMVQLQKNIYQNIEKIEQQSRQMKYSSKKRDDIQSYVNIKVDDLQRKELEMPSTVCTEKKCCKFFEINGSWATDYTTKCHKPCQITGIESNTLGNIQLQHCTAFDSGRTENCLTCKCHWTKHMHIQFEYIKVNRTIIDLNMMRNANKLNKNVIRLSDVIQITEETVKEFKNEQTAIELIAARFGYFLITNSNTAFNKFLEPYLDVLIEEQKNILSIMPNSSSPMAALTLLINMKEDHQEMVKKLSADIAKGTTKDVSLEDIPAMRQQLLNLKHHGAQFRQILECSQKSNSATLQVFDRVGLM